MTDFDKKDKHNQSDQEFFNVSFDRPIQDNSEDASSKDSPDRLKRSSKWNDFYERFKEEEERVYGQDYDSSPLNFQKLDDIEKEAKDIQPEPPKETLNRRSRLNQSIDKVQDILKDANQQPAQRRRRHTKSRSSEELAWRNQPAFLKPEEEIDASESHLELSQTEVTNQEPKDQAHRRSFLSKLQNRFLSQKPSDEAEYGSQEDDDALENQGDYRDIQSPISQGSTSEFDSKRLDQMTPSETRDDFKDSDQTEIQIPNAHEKIPAHFVSLSNEEMTTNSPLTRSLSSLNEEERAQLRKERIRQLEALSDREVAESFRKKQEESQSSSNIENTDRPANNQMENSKDSKFTERVQSTPEELETENIKYFETPTQEQDNDLEADYRRRFDEVHQPTEESEASNSAEEDSKIIQQEIDSRTKQEHLSTPDEITAHDKKIETVDAEETQSTDESDSLVVPLPPLPESELSTNTETLASEASEDTAHIDDLEDLEDTDAAADMDATTSRVSKRKEKKSRRKEHYSLSEYSPKKKIGFGFSVALNVFKKLAIILLVLLVLGGALVGGAGIGYFASLVSGSEPPSREEMESQIYQLDQQSTLYYASGEPIANVRADVVRSVTNLDEVSNYIIDGFIATEDEYFEEHPGIVPKAILRAVLETFISGSGTGGSTLTQQLVKQQLLSNEVTFFRKANEILLALRVENYFSKDEILTAYLNVSPFGRNNNGDNVAGIGKASEGIFGVRPDEVTLNQAAFLAGLPQDPYNYTPYDQYGQLRENLEPGINRMKDVLFRMYRDQKISKEEYDEAIAYDITQDFLPTVQRTEERQSYLYQAVMHGAILELMRLNIEDDGYTWEQVNADVDWYNQYYFDAENQLRTSGYKVYSTIDKEIYEQLQVSAQAYDDEIGVTYDGVYTDPQTGHETYFIEKVQTGLVALENETGKVLGFVSGTDFENNQIDHAFNMRRSPGSTIKPMAVYGPAIENNLINPATIIPDTAFVQEYNDGTTWTPTNYGNAVSNTFMTVRRALLRSDNLPVVRIYEQLLNEGVPIIDYLEKMGFDTMDSYTEEDTMNLAFSLGGVTTGPTVFEETRGFSTFANNGHYIDGYYIERIEDSFGNVVFQQNEPPVEVFSEDTNYLMVDMLRDTMDQGTGRTANEYLEVPGDWIAKTGISENSKDIWVIASTPKITIGSWIGYDSKYYDYTIDVNDGFGLESVRSQIYWARIVNDLYAIRPEIFGSEMVFQQPESVRSQQILQDTGTLPGQATFNGQTYSMSQPLTEDLFKLSNPAPELTGDFIFAATPEEQAYFWSQHVSVEEMIRRQHEATRTTSQESDESEESSGDENEDSSETPPNDGGQDSTVAPPSETDGP